MKLCFLCDRKSPSYVRRWYRLCESTCNECTKLYREKKIDVYQKGDGSLALAPCPGATKCKIISFKRKVNGAMDYSKPELVPVGDVDSPEEMRAGSPHPPTPNLGDICGELDCCSTEEDENSDIWSDDIVWAGNRTADDYSFVASAKLCLNGAGSSGDNGLEGQPKSIDEINKLKDMITGSLKAYQADLDKPRRELHEKEKMIGDFRKKIETNETSHKARVGEMSADIRKLSEKLQLAKEETHELTKEIAHKEAEIAQLRNFVGRVLHLPYAWSCESQKIAEVMQIIENGMEAFRNELMKILPYYKA